MNEWFTVQTLWDKDKVITDAVSWHLSSPPTPLTPLPFFFSSSQKLFTKNKKVQRNGPTENSIGFSQPNEVKPNRAQIN